MFEEYKQPDANLIVTDVNRWIKNKKMMADLVTELPGFNAVAYEITKRINTAMYTRVIDSMRRQVIDQFLQDNPHDDLSLFSLGKTRDERESHLRHISYENLFMMDIQATNETKTVDVFSWLDPKHKYLTFTVEMKSFGDPEDPDGDYNPNAAVSVSVSGAFPSQDDYMELGKKALGMDFVERWKLAPFDFQNKNPICPYCGGPVNGDLTSGSHTYAKMVCNCDCGWEMRKHADYISDLDDSYADKFFDSELEHLQKQLNKEAMADTQMESIEKALKTLGRLYSKTSEGRPERREAIQKMLDKYLEIQK